MLDRYLKVLPQHIKDSNSELILFLKAYYKWLENNKVVFEYVAKEERTSLDDSEFLEYLKAEILAAFPAIVVDESLLLKHIKEYYVSKGTEESIKFLLKVTLGVDSSVFYPADFLFKPSAATWVREFAVRFNLASGNVTDTLDVPIEIKSLTRTIKTNAKVIAQVSGTLYEITLPSDFNLATNTNFTVTGATFSGTLVKTIVKKTIRARGRGFQIGDIFEINTSGGSGTKIKVTRVSNTGIRAFDIIQFGQGYLTNFEHAISPNLNVQVTENRNFTITNDGIPTQYTSPDNVDKIVDEYQISKFTYLQSTDYLENNTYVGSLQVAGQSEVTGNQLETSEDSAVVFFELGYVFAYPGYYLTNEGMTSDVSRIQDGEYWQQFSYVIKSEKQYDEYQAAVKRLVHPAGLRMFGEYNIDKQISLAIDIKTYLAVLQIAFEDTTSVSADINNKELIKNILYYYDNVQVNTAGDTLSTNTGDLSFGEPEKFSLIDQIALTLNKPLPDLVTQAADQYYLSIEKYLEELVSTTDALVITLNKQLQEELVTFDLPIKTVSKNVVRTVDYGVTHADVIEALAISSADLLSVGGSDIFGILSAPDLTMQFGLDSILMSEADTLDLGDSTTLSTYSGSYVLEDNNYSNLASSILHDLNIGNGYTLAIPNTNLVITSDIDVLVTGEYEVDSIVTREVCGVVVNPYYSILELNATGTPYWQFGYTRNERRNNTMTTVKTFRVNGPLAYTDIDDNFDNLNNAKIESAIPNFEVKTSSGTFIVPAGVTKLRVTVVGGGAAGGTGGGAAGGGAGGVAIKVISGLTSGTQIPYVVGAAGGSSNFGGYCSASGGSVGGSTPLTSGGLGGVGTGGDINLRGSGGSPSYNSSIGGAGGAGLGGAGGGRGILNNAGEAGFGYGAGGAGGSATNTTGGAGAPGVILIEW